MKVAAPMVGVDSCGHVICAFCVFTQCRDDVLARLRVVLDKQRIVNESDHFSVSFPDGTMARLPCMPMMPLCG